MMAKYARSRLKDSVVVVVWVIAIIPVLPFCAVMMMHDFFEKITDWYDGFVIAPIRKWRNKWNPMR